MLPNKYRNLRKQASELLKKKSFVKNKTVLHSLDVKDKLYELDIYQVELELQNEELRHKQMELELSREKYIELYDDAPIGYFTLNSHSLILDVNKVGASLINYKFGQLLKKYFNQYIANEYQEVYYRHKENVLNNPGIQTCEVKMLRQNGESFYVQISSKQISRKSNDNIDKVEILTFVNDISSRKEAEIWIREKQKNIFMINNISVIEQMANRLSNDINQPLSVLINYINGCKRQLDTIDVNRKAFMGALNQSLEAAYQAINIINRMKNFSISRIMNTKAQCLDSLIQDTVTILNFENSDFPIKIYYDSHGERINVIADKIYLQQVFLNIARHAIQQMKKVKTIRPRICIDVSIQYNHTTFITLFNNSYTSCDTDDANEDQAHPDYISVSQSIVEAHGGRLNIHSKPDGTYYSFNLPMIKD